MLPELSKPDYYYRVDSLTGLRSVSRDAVFRPARWQHEGKPWPHVALIEAAQDIPDAEAIYRLSFWVGEAEARTDLAQRGRLEPHGMMRVRREAVASALPNWNFHEDDFLRGRADLIWARRQRAGDTFFDGGVSLEDFELLEDDRWVPWPFARSAQPDSSRLAGAGWLPLALRARYGPVIAYWRTATLARSGDEPQRWILLTLEEGSGRTLGSETDAVQQALHLLLSGPLYMAEGSIAGLLTVHTTMDRLWTEQYAVAIATGPKPSLWRRLMSGGGQPSRVWCAQRENLISVAEERALIKTSGLRFARPEVPARIWGVAR